MDNTEDTIEVPASTPEIILTAKVGRNNDVFPDILKLYAKPGDAIADVTYGKGVFWNKTLYKLKESDISTGVDCRKLPYEPISFDMVIFDPPYIYNPADTVKKSISSTYRVNETGLGLVSCKAVLQLYQDGMVEAFRILKSNGILVVKCQDQIEAGKQKWMHISIFEFAVSLGMLVEDLLVLVQQTRPAIRWPNQKHARKNHSYFWIFRKK